ncbi:hypothetical protein H0G86_010032 [Trichoderma simmonsii]|uniref:Uncharacterized protein n=1 Tax=Trichoderma simmonsii TaxID=1491479 RepID=A0A8G0LIP9_9HYPO|nr:hypothetical protein H0G86_010032 [Trichoderma simmonsii]
MLYLSNPSSSWLFYLVLSLAPPFISLPRLLSVSYDSEATGILCIPLHFNVQATAHTTMSRSLVGLPSCTIPSAADSCFFLLASHLSRRTQSCVSVPWVSICLFFSQP